MKTGGKPDPNHQSSFVGGSVLSDLLARLAFRYRTTLILLGMGLLAGILGGLLGVGSGMLVVPGLMFFLSLDPRKAHGTSLVAALLLSAAGVAIYARDGAMDFLFAAELAAGGVVGALLGARAARTIKAAQLRAMLGTLLVVMGLRMITGALLYGHGAPTGTEWLPFASDAMPGLLTGLGAGLGTGFVSALVGVGGGAIMVPVMVILLGVPQKLAQGISLAAMAPTAFAGILMHGAMGNISFRVGKWIGFGAAVGALIGSAAAMKLSAPILATCFGAFLLLTAAFTILKPGANNAPTKDN